VLIQVARQSSSALEADLHHRLVDDVTDAFSY